MYDGVCARVCVCVCACVCGAVSGLAAAVPSVCHYDVDRTVAQVNYHGNRLIIPIKHYWAYWGRWLHSTHSHSHTHTHTRRWTDCVSEQVHDERHQRAGRKHYIRKLLLGPMLMVTNE